MPEATPSRAAAADKRAEPQTSLDTYQPTEVTVRFRRWTSTGNTAYLRGQEAGFSEAEAAAMVRRGLHIDIVHRRPVLADRMVTK